MFLQFQTNWDHTIQLLLPPQESPPAVHPQHRSKAPPQQRHAAIPSGWASAGCGLRRPPVNPAGAGLGAMIRPCFVFYVFDLLCFSEKDNN